MQFAELNLAEPILRAVATQGYTTATPIQAEAIPHVLVGRDLLGSAQTGTGKTAAFALPILHRLSTIARRADKPTQARCLILAPTRELATQISDDFRVYGQHLRIRQAVIFGGVNQNPQVQSLRRGVDIIVATPGRLLDLMNQGHVDLSGVGFFVLDEADRMLDMGFIHDIRTIAAKVPQTKQTLLFSATMPPPIRQLADAILRDPAVVQMAASGKTAAAIEQGVYFVARQHKVTLLAHLYHTLPMARTIVFTRTKRGADRVVDHLEARGIKADAIHGNKSQNARQRALDGFRSGKTPVLVATDVASRGIDVDLITHVVNYDLTDEPETYVHRIGRTGRAGATGMAVSFCDVDERPYLKAIERMIKGSIPVRTDHPEYTAATATKAPNDRERRERDDRDNRDRFERRENARRSHGASSSSSHGHRSASRPSHAPHTAHAPRAPRATHATHTPHVAHAPKQPHAPVRPAKAAATAAQPHHDASRTPAAPRAAKVGHRKGPSARHPVYGRAGKAGHSGAAHKPARRSF